MRRDSPARTSSTLASAIPYAALLSSDTDVQLSFMVLRIASFIPAAWAIFIAYYLHHINRDPHQDDFGPHSLTALTVGIVMLNLLIAVPIRGVRLAATLVLFAFVVVLFFELGAWWLPGLIVAIIVTVLDWTRKRDAVEENEENP